MAKMYGYDITKPTNGKRQFNGYIFTYFTAIKNKTGKIYVLGRVATLDIYFARDIAAGVFTEEEIQEIIDDLSLN